MNPASIAPRAPSAPAGLARPVLVSAVLFLLVTGIAYPLATTGVAQLLFPAQAQGSLIVRDGSVVGSRQIGQKFSDARYFHGRPSLTSDRPYNAAGSGASNQGVLSRKLLADVAQRAQAYRAVNGLAADAPVPVDAVTASGSGLDPHISLANARLQLARVARARGLDAAQLLALVERHSAGRQLGVLGEPRVHVLELNLALDEAGAPTKAAR